MSDDSTPITDTAPIAPAAAPAPAATPLPVHAAWMQPTTQQIADARERATIERMFQAHDAARAAAPMVKLTAVVSFTVVDDGNPDGRVVNMGDEFEVSEFDLPKYLGKGLPRADDATRARHFGK